jgi:hypothetical protein
MPVRDYDSRQGQAFQGDIAIIPMPADIEIATSDEIAPSEGRLTIHTGELSGHHHAIDLFEHAAHFRDGGLAHAPESEAMTTARPAQRATARFYRARWSAHGMVSRGVLTRDDLAIGYLVVEGDPVVLTHEEHDGIRIPCGRYLVVRQTGTAE